MGICFSVQKDPRDSVVKPRSVSNDEKQSIPSPVKGKTNTVNGGNLTVADVVLNSQQSSGRFTAAGSKDDAFYQFYDSQPWLESDAEDDYFSVRGDFTPSQSRGSTPVHNSSFSLENQHAKSSPHVETNTIIPEPVPVPPSEEKKMRLLELFKESFPDGGETKACNENDQAPAKVEDEAISGLVRKSKSGNGSSFCNSGSIDVNGQVQILKENESLKSAQCCLPGLLPSRSSGERRKRRSPAKDNCSG